MIDGLVRPCAVAFFWLCLGLAMPLFSARADSGSQRGQAHYIPLQKNAAYDVEVLVFSRGTDQASLPVESIQWLDTADTIQILPRPAQWPEWKWPATQATTEESATNGSDWTMPLDSGQELPRVLVDYLRRDLFLKKTRAKLASQPGWQVLLHKKWRLQPSDFKHPTYLDLSTVAAQSPLPADQTAFDSNPEVSADTMAENVIPALPPGLIGKLAFSKGRYLHVDAQLQAIQPPHNGRQKVATLQEKRRVHSRVLQYFDHPDMGLLVLITPVTAPENPTKASPEPPQDISVKNQADHTDTARTQAGENP